MKTLASNVTYSLIAAAALVFAVYAPAYTVKAVAGAEPQLYRAGDEIRGVVVGVMDGDTLKLLSDDQRELRIRLAEIDAPESRQDFGDAAKRSLSDLAYNKPAAVRVVGSDRYGLLIGRVFVGTLDLNLAQVGRGLAWANPTEVQDERIRTLEARVREARVGLWRDKEPIAPWEYRKSEG